MPLSRRSQVAAKVEVVPSVEATGLAGVDVVEVLNAEYTQSRSMIARQPSDPSLSGVVEGIGRGEAGTRFDVDWRGSGVVTTKPDWAKLVEACFHRSSDAGALLSLSLSGGGLTEALYAGDTLTGGTSGETATVAAYAAAGATTVKVFDLSGSLTVAENINSAQQGNAVGVVASDPMGGADAGFTWAPISDRTMSFAITGAWGGGNPAVGEGVVIKAPSTAIITGQGYVVVPNTGSVCTIELAWGTIVASSTLVSTAGKTNTVHGAPAFANVQGPSLTMLMNRDKFRRGVTGARGTFRMECEAGGIGRASFEFKGRARAAEDAAFISGASLSAIVPPRFQGGAFALNGIRVPIKSFSFDAGVNVVMRADGNSEEGDWGAEVVSRDPSFSFVVDQGPLAFFDFHTPWKNGTTMLISYTLGSAVGNTMSFIGVGQITEISDGDADGIATLSINCKLRRSTSAGDNEYLITMV